jgi:hypothetical protein
MIIRSVLLLAIIFSFFSFRAMQAQVQAQGDRILSYSVSNSETQSFDDAFSFAVDNCMELSHLQFVWGQAEEQENVWNNEIIALMDVVNIYYPIFDMKLELNIGTLNTGINDIPDDLLDISYDDPQMANRFKAFLDTLFFHIPQAELGVLSIGNEVDFNLGTDEQKYLEYKAFLNEVVPYAKQKYLELHEEELKVATTITFEGLTSELTADLCADLNEGLDVINVTYYPLLDGFQMDDPQVVFDDFQAIVDAYNTDDRPIYFVECGYASSAVCGSSEELQASFYENMFSAWDEQMDRIKSVSIFKLADWSQEEVEAFGEYYNLDDPAFLEYLRTLGIRTYPGLGEDKLALETIRCELSARSWCDGADCSTAIMEGNEPSPEKIYPNPTSGSFRLKTISPILEYQIINAMGMIVRSEQLSAVQNNLQLDLGKEAPGHYLLRVQTSERTITRRLILE